MDMTAVLYRPKKIRWVAVPLAVGVALLFTFMGFGLSGSEGFQNSKATFQAELCSSAWPFLPRRLMMTSWGCSPRFLMPLPFHPRTG